MSEALKRAGAQLANVAFNLAQQPGHALTSDDVVLLDKLRREWDAACRALSAQPPAPIVPDGWRMVPVEPTYHMLRESLIPAAEAARYYGRMLSAAPPPVRERLTDREADMLQALRRAVLALAFAAESSPAMADDYKAVSAAIERATGEAQ